MKGSRVHFRKAMILAVSFAGVLWVWGTATSSAAVVMIDDFSSPTLSPEYVQSTTFMGNGTVTVTFESLGAKTKVTLHQTVLASVAQRMGALPSWHDMLDRLAGELATSRR